MDVNEGTKIFICDDAVSWEQIDTGVSRKIMAYDDKLMLVKVAFETGAVGSLHHHYHSQITYIESGSFEIEINGEMQILKKGDTFYIPPNTSHQVTCLDAGVLIDAFSPMREDFFK